MHLLDNSHGCTMNEKLNTACECSEHEGERSFFCKRHKCKKSASYLRHCQKGDEYWVAWEEGRGPGQIQAPKEETPAPSAPPKAPQSKALQTPKRAQARRLACKECPAGHWDETKGVCRMRTSRQCVMRQYFNRAQGLCTHWPE